MLVSSRRFARSKPNLSSGASQNETGEGGGSIVAESAVDGVEKGRVQKTKMKTTPIPDGGPLTQGYAEFENPKPVGILNNVVGCGRKEWWCPGSTIVKRCSWFVPRWKRKEQE
jgi:hypothetical protein